MYSQETLVRSVTHLFKVIYLSWNIIYSHVLLNARFIRPTFITC